MRSQRQVIGDGRPRSRYYRLSSFRSSRTTHASGGSTVRSTLYYLKVALIPERVLKPRLATLNSISILTAAMCVAGPLAGLYHGRLWVDEVFTYEEIAAPTLSRHLQLVYRLYDHPPLYFHIAWIWAKFSHNLVYLRSLSTLFVVASLLFVVHFARTRVSQRGPLFLLWLAAALAFSPVVMQVAGTLRQYGFVLFIGIAYLLALERALDGNRKMQMLSALLGGAYLVSTHFAVLLLAPMEVLALVIWFRSPARPSGYLLSLRLIVLSGFAGLWATFGPAQLVRNKSDVIVLTAGSGGMGRRVLDTLAAFHGWPTAPAIPEWFRSCALVVATVFICVELYLLLRSKPDRQFVFWTFAAYVPVALLALTFLWKPIMAPRFVITSAAAIWMLHGIALTKLRRMVRIILAASSIVLVSGAVLFMTTLAAPPYEQYAASILESVGPQDVLVLLPGSQKPIYEFIAAREKLPMPATVSIPQFVESDFNRTISELPSLVMPFRRACVVYELPGLFDPQKRVQRFFEKNWQAGPYHLLWGRRWVYRYYDNRAFAPPPK